MFLLTLYLVVIGVCVVYVDLQEMRIPNILSFACLLGLFAYIVTCKPSLMEVGGGILLGMVMLLSCYYMTKGGIGEGDIKMCFSLCGMMGLSGIFYFLFGAALLSLPVGLFHLLKKKGKTYAFPFGPFLVLSFLVIWLFKKEVYHLWIQ